MALLKGLVACTVGLVSVLVFCGSVSGIVERGAADFYLLQGSEPMMDRFWTCVVWFVFFLYLTFFVALVVLKLKKPLVFVLCITWGILHTTCVLCVFYFKILYLGLISLTLVIGIYIYLAFRLSKVMPKLSWAFLPYLVWLGYLFSILYAVTALN